MFYAERQVRFTAAEKQVQQQAEAGRSLSRLSSVHACPACSHAAGASSLSHPGAAMFKSSRQVCRLCPALSSYPRVGGEKEVYVLRSVHCHAAARGELPLSCPVPASLRGSPTDER